MDKEKYKDVKSILDIPREDRIKFIENTISSDSYYTEETGDFHVISLNANEVIERFFKYNKSSPLIIKGQDKIYFEPDADLLSRNSYVAAQAKYATHFVTGSPPDGSRRFYDSSKVSLIPRIIDAVQNPDRRLKQHKKESIIYVKQIKTKKYCCSIFRIELYQDGDLRAVTAFYSDEKYIKTKEAFNFWSNAPFQIFTEKSPSDETASRLSGDTDISRAQDKDTNNNDTNKDNDKKMHMGGKIKNLIEFIEKKGKVIWEYQVDESAHHGSGSAIMYDYNGRAYEIVTWNKNAEQHRVGEKTIAIEEKKVSRGEAVKQFFDNINWLITGE